MGQNTTLFAALIAGFFIYSVIKGSFGRYLKVIGLTN